MKFNTITFKLLSFIIGTFAIMIISVLTLANIQLTRIIDRSQETIYTERIDAILWTLKNYDDRLKKTGLVETYADDFKESAIKDLKKVYYKRSDQSLPPFIIDAEGRIIMHPELPEGDLSHDQAKTTKEMLRLEKESFNCVYLGQKHWCIYKQFSEWGWAIGYSVPVDIKYGDVRSFNTLLFFIMAGITIVLMVILSLVVARFTKPITKLTTISTRLADGDLDQQIDLGGKDEVGTLAQSFAHMQDSIKEKIETLKRLTTILEATSDLVSIIAPDGHVLYMNRAGRQIVGWQDKKNIAEKNIAEIHPDWALHIIKDQGIPTAIKKGIWQGETALLQPHGHEALVSQLIMSHKSPNGKLEYISTMMRDITARKQVENALQESEKKYRYLFKNAPAGIYEIDFEKIRFTRVNDVMCRYTGYSEKEFLSMNPIDLLTEDSKNKYIKRLEKLATGKRLPDNVEYSIVKKDGQELYVILNSDFIYKNGELKAAQVVAHDISDRKRIEEEKIKAQKIAGEHEKLALVGQIAGKMAHDFNNVLGVIMGNAQLSLLDCREPKTIKTLELIFNQTLRGKNLTKNLLAFARDQEPKQEFFRINEKMDLILSLLKKDLDGIELVKEDKSGIPELLADPGMIEHALINIVQNSIHAVSRVKNPRIIMRSYANNNTICFEIEDNGCGILKKHLKKIYIPSFTLKGSNDVSGSYKSGIKGTGYGMANVKKYIELHKGTISIESEPGSGTKVTISLPVIKKQLTKEEKILIQEEKNAFEKYILLVEDEPAISDIQYVILTQEPCNHKVDIAQNGQMAMDLFERNEYDFVSLDYILPGEINGMDVYHHIRETDKNIPILFVSGNIEFLESIKNLKQKDTNLDHLSKPCQNKDYINAINKLLE